MRVEVAVTMAVEVEVGMQEDVRVRERRLGQSSYTRVSAARLHGGQARGIEVLCSDGRRAVAHSGRDAVDPRDRACRFIGPSPPSMASPTFSRFSDFFFLQKTAVRF